MKEIIVENIYNQNLHVALVAALPGLQHLNHSICRSDLKSHIWLPTSQSQLYRCLIPESDFRSPKAMIFHNSRTRNILSQILSQTYNCLFKLILLSFVQHFIICVLASNERWTVKISTCTWVESTIKRKAWSNILNYLPEFCWFKNLGVVELFGVQRSLCASKWNLWGPPVNWSC